MSAADIARGLGLRRGGRAYTGRCPSCGYEGAFTVEDRAGTTLVRCHVGCEQRDAIDALRGVGLWGCAENEVRAFSSAKVAKVAKVADATATAVALALWSRATPATTSAGANPVAR